MVAAVGASQQRRWKAKVVSDHLATQAVQAAGGVIHLPSITRVLRRDSRTGGERRDGMKQMTIINGTVPVSGPQQDVLPQTSGGRGQIDVVKGYKPATSSKKS